jgi:hypothetical protein
MIPPKRSFVNLGQRESSPLIWILDMREVIVEVVEGGVSTCGSAYGHCVRSGQKQSRSFLIKLNNLSEVGR